MLNTHYKKICQYGVAHEQCRCPGPKRLASVVCNQPDLHRPLETPAKGWQQGDSVEDGVLKAL